MTADLASLAAAALEAARARPMSPDELREILAGLAWSQRFAGELTIGERRLRAMAAGRAEIPPELAAWLRLVAACPPPREAP